MKRKRASLESISGKKFMILLYSRSLGKWDKYPTVLHFGMHSSEKSDLLTITARPNQSLRYA
jgi:hypothetical protein